MHVGDTVCYVDQLNEYQVGGRRLSAVGHCDVEQPLAREP